MVPEPVPEVGCVLASAGRQRPRVVVTNVRLRLGMTKENQRRHGSRVAVMEILVLGGTAFVGRAIVDDLITRGHTPTLFARGVTNPAVFPDLQRRVGDRDTGDYTSLATGEWDAVIDVSAYVPRHVDQAMTAVGDRGSRYLLISTVSVYDVARAPEQGLSEDSPRLPEVRDTEVVDGATYGGLKVACEDDVVARLGARATIVRPGIVAGPWDTTDRFTWWARRGAQGGRVAVPGRLEQPVQVVDSRDLARLCARLVEDDRAGIFNAVGVQTTLDGLIRTCAEAVGAAVDLVPVAPVERDSGFPLVVADPGWDRLFRASSAAHAAGLPVTPLVKTATETQAWDRERGLPDIARAFVGDQEERALAGAR